MSDVMNTNFLLAFFILIVFVFLSRMLNEQAMKKLSSEQKVQLIDLFSKERIGFMGILVVLLGLFFASLSLQWVAPFTAYVAYLSCVFLFIAFTSAYSYRKLKSHHFPGSYIFRYLLSTGLRILGTLIFLAFTFTSFQK